MSSCPDITDLWPHPESSSSLYISLLAEATDIASGMKARLVAHGPFRKRPWSVELFFGQEPSGKKAEWDRDSTEPIRSAFHAIESLLDSDKQISKDMRDFMKTQALSVLVDLYERDLSRRCLTDYELARGDVSCFSDPLSSIAWKLNPNPSFRATLMDALHASSCQNSLTINIGATSSTRPTRVLVLAAGRDTSSATYFDATKELPDGWPRVCRVSLSSPRVASLLEPLRDAVKEEGKEWSASEEELKDLAGNGLTELYKAALDGLKMMDQKNRNLGSL